MVDNVEESMGDKMMQIEYGPKVRGVSVDTCHCSDERHGALCPHDEHSVYATDRLLREGSRVTVAIAADDYSGDWHVEELRCLHCPLTFDVHEVVGDWSVYDYTNVIIAEATLGSDGDGFELIDPYILCAKVALPGF
jgi:hypothetical protein